MKIGKGWYLVDAEAPHELLAGPFGFHSAQDWAAVEVAFNEAEAYAKENFLPHAVAFLFVDHDNFAWGE